MSFVDSFIFEKGDPLSLCLYKEKKIRPLLSLKTWGFDQDFLSGMWSIVLFPDSGRFQDFKFHEDVSRIGVYLKYNDGGCVFI